MRRRSHLTSFHLIRQTEPCTSFEMTEPCGRWQLDSIPAASLELLGEVQAHERVHSVQVRYCSDTAGDKKRRCPVSGAVLKFSRGKVARTPDYALRKVIRHQALQAKACPGCDALLRCPLSWFVARCQLHACSITGVFLIW